MNSFFELISLVLVGVLVLFGVSAGAHYLQGHWGDHIIPHESGAAVYIAGDSCTVNMKQEENLEEIQERLNWCMSKHFVWKEWVE